MVKDDTACSSAPPARLRLSRVTLESLHGRSDECLGEYPRKMEANPTRASVSTGFSDSFCNYAKRGTVATDLLVSSIAQRVATAVCEHLATRFPTSGAPGATRGVIVEEALSKTNASIMETADGDGKRVRWTRRSTSTNSRLDKPRPARRNSSAQMTPRMSSLVQSLDDQFLMNSGVTGRPGPCMSPTASESSNQFEAQHASTAKSDFAGGLLRSRSLYDAQQPASGSLNMTDTLGVLPAPALTQEHAKPKFAKQKSRWEIHQQPITRETAVANVSGSSGELPHVVRFDSTTAHHVLKCEATADQTVIGADAAGTSQPLSHCESCRSLKRSFPSMGHLQAHQTSHQLMDMRVTQLTEEIPTAHFAHLASMRSVRSALSQSLDSAAVGCSATDVGCPGPPPLMLRFCGIFPWEKMEYYYATDPEAARGLHSKSSLPRAYQLTVLLSSAASTFALAFIFARGLMFECSCPYAARALLSDLPLAACAVFGLLFLGVGWGQGIPSQMRGLLQAFTLRADKLEAWEETWSSDRTITVLLWLGSVMARITSSQSVRAVGYLWLVVAGDTNDRDHGACDWWLDVVQVVSFAIVSGIVVSIACFLHHLCRSLTIMVDHFCCETILSPDMSAAMHEWNVLQAVMRKISAAMSLCFCTLVLAGSCVGPMLVADFLLDQQVLPVDLVPSGLVMISVARMVFSAAAITEKCEHVPSLINAFSFGMVEGQARETLVNYIIHSAAGFYVLDMRLTLANVLRCTYFSGVIAASLATMEMS